MYQVIRELHFCYGHRIVGHAGKCGNLHGHNAKVQLVLQSEEVNELGMVVDFAEIKQKVGSWIETDLDHKMILAKNDPLLPALSELGVKILPTENAPTAENMARLVFEQAKQLGLPVIEVRFFEGPFSQAVWKESRLS
jgi:6-pyruvoyltetrahydropterin/6-carboxytetrahydropterin synthase